MIGLLLAGLVFQAPSGGAGGIDFKFESETTVVDPANSVFLRVEMKVPHDRTARMPDLRDRVVGFSLAEDYPEEQRKLKDGSTLEVTNWRLIPEPCAPVYKIRPFLVSVSPKVYRSQADEGKYSFVAGPIRFESPAVREPVTGGMEADPQKDWSAPSWKMVVGVLGSALGGLAALAAVGFGVAYLFRRVKEHRMSPIERAWVELDRLLKKGLPGRGRYKDFYVELTMVVRRYVQRTYGIRAPHLTTEEFLKAFGEQGIGSGEQVRDELRRFLDSADLVKFAGVAATPEMADAATETARDYLKRDGAVRRPSER